MPITVAKHIGYCGGVARAVDKILSLSKSHKTVYCIGNIINNKHFIDSLPRNIIVVKSAFDVPNNAVAVIRTHGISKDDEALLLKKNCTVFDETCVNVAKTHKIARDYSDRGYAILLFGEISHPEVIGTASYAKNVTVCSYDTDINLLAPLSEKFCIIAQTTADVAEYQSFTEKFSGNPKFSAKTLEVIDTICYTTKERQEELRGLSKNADLTLVIGDKASANSQKLLAIAKQNSPSYLIENVADLQSVSYKNQKLAIASGASTPNGLITEVINIMSEHNHTATAVNEAVTADAIKEQKTEKPLTMDQVMKGGKYGGKMIREGGKHRATVISADDSGINVSVADVSKNDSGFISRDEAELDGTYNKDNYKTGDVIDVVIIAKNMSDKSKSLNLSKKQYDAIKVDDEAVRHILDGAEFTLACTQEVKGGLLGKLGSYTIFVPASQIRIGHVANLSEYIGKPLRLKAMPPKEGEGGEDKDRRRNAKRIVASQRVILEAERGEKEDALWSIMQVNNIVKGKVKRFCAFGAFVSVGGFDCLCHISDISWGRIKDASEVLELNKEYEFVILKVDRAMRKVSIGYKQLQKKPYELAAEKYPVGSVITGKVERIFPFGAFVQIEPGIDGLVHVSQITNKFIKSASEVLTEGQEIRAKIMGFSENKITLSIKELGEEPATAGTATEGDTAGDKKDGKRKPKGEKGTEEPKNYVSPEAQRTTLADTNKDLAALYEKLSGGDAKDEADDTDKPKKGKKK